MVVNKLTEDHQAIYSSLINSLPFKVFIKDINSHFADCNEDFASFLNLPIENIIGKTDYDLFPLRLSKQHRVIDKKILSGLSSSEAEETYRIGSQEFNFKAVYKPIKDESGNTIGILGMLVDSSNHRKEPRYENIFQTAYDGFCITDNERKITYVNDTFCNMLRFTRDELLNQDIVKIEDTLNSNEMYMHFQDVIDKGFDRFETILIGKDNTATHVEISIVFSVRNKGEYILSIRDISDRIFAEAKLKESEHRYQTLAEISPAGIFHTDVNGITTYVNSRWCQISGMSFQDALGNGWIEAVHPDDRESLMNGWSNSVESNKDSVSDYRFLRNDGSIVWVMGKAVPEMNLDGEIVGYVGTIVDITKRKLAEESLTQSEKLYREVVEHSSDLIYSVDIKGKFTFANKAALSISGYTLEELTKLYYYELVLPEYREKLKKFYLNQLDKRIPTQYLEFPFKARDGEIKWFGQSTTIKYEGERIAGFQITARDITERKLAEDALQQERILLRTLIDNLPDAVYVKDKEGRKTVANLADIHNMGHQSENEVLGKDDFELFPKEIAEKFYRDDQTVLQQGESILNREEFLIDPDGKKKWLHTSKVPLRDDKGNIYGLVGIGRDITEKKYATEAIKKNERLLKSAQRIAKLGYFTLDISNRIWTGNEILYEIFGIDKSYKTTIESWLQLIHPDHREKMQVYLRDEVIGKKNPFSAEYKVVRVSDGEIRWVHSMGELVFDDNGNLIQMTGTSQDITDSKKSEKQIRKLNRIYAVLSEINQAIVRGRNQEELFSNVCQIAVTKGCFKMAWIGMINRASQKIKLTAHSGESGFDKYFEEYSDSLEDEFYTYYPEKGTLWNKQHIAGLLDPKAEQLEPHRKKAYEFGCRSFASFPLYVSGRIEGSINFYSGESDFFDEEELKLLDELTMDISFAMEVQQRETKRKQIEKELRTSEERFRSLYENSTVGIYRTTPDGKILLANPALIKILGFSSFEELSKKDLNEEGFETSNDRAKFIEQIEKDGEVKGLEFGWKKQDGTLAYIRESARAVRDTEGRSIYYDGIIEDITERKKAEIALCTSESQLLNALDIAHLGHWEYDVINDQFTFNDQFYKIFRTNAQQVGGYTMSSAEYSNRFVYPDDIPTVGIEIKTAIESDDPDFNRELEHRIIYADGEIGYITVRFFIVKDDQGRTIKTYGVNQDITERRLIEEKIKQSEQEYRRLFENAHDAILILNPDDEMVMDVNERACELYGFSKSEFIGMSLDKITRDVNVGKDKIKKLLSDGYVDGFETVQHTKYGEELILEINASMIEYKGRKAILSLNHNITDRKHAENELEIAYDQLSSLYTNLPEAVFSVDYINQKMLQVSPAHETVFGYKPEEFFKDPQFWSKIIVPEDKSIVDATYELLHSGQSIQNQFRIYRPDGTINWIETRIKAIKDNEGRLIRIDGIASNITERKKAEKDIIAAKEKAEEMNRLKTIFLTNMSHELRTPLIGLLGLSEFMLDEVDGDLKENINLINQSGQRLLRTLSTILDYAKIEAEKLDIIPTEISLVEFLRKQIKLFQPLAKSRGVNIIEDFLSNDFKIISDEKLLYDIINNLISNAVKFTSEGTITVQTLLKEDELLIKISDTGIGIPEDKFETIFEEFRQVSEGANRSFEGTGLGLAIVKKYVSLLSGKITVESEIDKGSTFTVYLPMNPGKDENKESDQNLLNTGGEGKIQPEDNNLKKILLVEDDSISRITIEKMLSQNYNVTTASNGTDAIEHAGEQAFDVILMDINLGRGIDGTQAASEIRKINGYESVPIFAMTAYAMDDEKEEFLKGSCSHYIAKPFTKKLILEELDKVLVNGDH